MKRLWFVVRLIIVPLLVSAQPHYDFGFKRDTQTSVLDSDSVLYRYAFAGGINSVRFSEIDVNNDGFKDLFAFEKHGNRILIFLNQGLENEIRYRYAPEYAHFFPELHDWVILKDYNHDGKEDIFTYGNGGITLYKNVSDDNSLKFELITEQLESFYYTNYVNIYCSPDDYLAIEDIDGDGDLDILNYMVLGKFVHYQRNYSVENGNDYDHFDFHLEEECWGHFAEGADDNTITLNVDCQTKAPEKKSAERHVGSTILAYDFYGNGVKDVIIGDVDYPELILLQNGGTPKEAKMLSQTSEFPNSDKPVKLYSMPVASFLDIDNDSQTEILVSPSDPSLTKSENINSVWLYHYDSFSQQFEFQTSAFLQEDMIDVGSGCYPILYDWNKDGLQDLFLANYGYYDSSSFNNYFLTSHYSSAIAYYKNIGTNKAPAFQLVTKDFGHFRKENRQAIYPAFFDFNQDGYTDILCGSSEKGLRLYMNNGDDTFQSAQLIDSQCGPFATPQLFDLDRDGKPDIICGNKKGTLSYFHNQSKDKIIDFQFVTDNFGKVDVCNHDLSFFGYSVPYLFRNQNNETVLFCGNEQGEIAYYKVVDNHPEDKFILEEKQITEQIGTTTRPLIEGHRIGLSISDLNDDNYPDLLIGNYAGGLSYFAGCPPVEKELRVQSRHNDDYRIYPNPVQDRITIHTTKNQETTYRLYSIQGKTITEITTIEDNISIDTSNYPSGIYLLEANRKGNKTTRKIVVSH